MFDTPQDEVASMSCDMTATDSVTHASGKETPSYPSPNEREPSNAVVLNLKKPHLFSPSTAAATTPNGNVVPSEDVATLSPCSSPIQPS